MFSNVFIHILKFKIVSLKIREINTNFFSGHPVYTGCSGSRRRVVFEQCHENWQQTRVNQS
jgi:hypothetical protein